MSTEEKQTVTIDGVAYYIDSMPEVAKARLQDLTIITNEISQLQTSIGIAEIAKTAVIVELAKFKEQFEVAE